MKVGILKPFRGSNPPMLDIYKQILQFNNIDFLELDINDQLFWEKVKSVDLFLAKVTNTDDDLALAAQIIPVISFYLKINCFPDYNTVWHYDDKVKQYYLLKNFGFPVVDTYIFWDKQQALKWAKTAVYPVVFKLKGGAGSSNVKLVRRPKEAVNLINKSFGSGIHPYFFDTIGKLKAFNFDPVKIGKYYLKPIYRRVFKDITGCVNYTRNRNYVYFQRYLPNNDFDTRVCILGKRAFAFKRYNRENDFRASGSNNYDMNRANIDMNFVKIAFEVSFNLGFQSMAYDFVYDEMHNPILIEMSYTYGDYPEFSTGFWDPDLMWHDGNYIPEYLELVDALNMPDLLQPDIKLVSPYQHAQMTN